MLRFCITVEYSADLNNPDKTNSLKLQTCFLKLSWDKAEKNQKNESFI